MIKVNSALEKNSHKDVLLWERLNDGTFNGYLKSDSLPILPEVIAKSNKEMVGDRLTEDIVLNSIMSVLADKFGITKNQLVDAVKQKVQN